MRVHTLAAVLLLAAVSPGAARVKTRSRDDWFRVSAPAKAKKRQGYRDADWKRLRKLLVSDVVLESEKRKWTVQFLVAYWRSPGVDAGMAKLLALHVPPSKMRAALKALAQGRKPQQAPSGELPGFDAGPEDTIQPLASSPPKQDPLEALLIAKAKEYGAKRDAIQQQQLALLQGTSPAPAADSAQVRRELTEVLLPLHNELCKLSDQYAAKFGPLALKGVLQRENLLEPLDAAQCP